MQYSMKNSLMPQLMKLSIEELKVSSYFLGIRRCYPLRWLPYLTGSEPNICLAIHIKDKRYSIQEVAIEHVKPDGTRGKPEWKANNLGAFYKDNIKLRQLNTAGHHSYELLIDLIDDVGQIKQYRETLLLTGYVPWWDSVVRGTLLVLGGAAVGATVTNIGWIISLFVR